MTLKYLYLHSTEHYYQVIKFEKTEDLVSYKSE